MEELRSFVELSPMPLSKAEGINTLVADIIAAMRMIQPLSQGELKHWTIDAMELGQSLNRVDCNWSTLLRLLQIQKLNMVQYRFWGEYPDMYSKQKIMMRKSTDFNKLVPVLMFLMQRSMQGEHNLYQEELPLIQQSFQAGAFMPLLLQRFVI